MVLLRFKAHLGWIGVPDGDCNWQTLAFSKAPFWLSTAPACCLMQGKLTTLKVHRGAICQGEPHRGAQNPSLCHHACLTMPGTSFDRFLTVHDVGRIEVRISVQKPWEQYQSHLQRLLPDEIYARELWTSPHPLVTQQILTGGACFTLVPKGFVAAGHWLPQNHTAYIKGKANKDVTGMQSIRVGFGSHPTKAELFLVPINAVQGKAGKPVPAFLGYIVPQETTLMADKLMQQSWLPVVLDLDETLLVANSAHQLLAQIHKATISRVQAAEEAASATAPATRMACEERCAALNHEIQSLEQDLNLLKQYRDGDCVIDPTPGGRGQVLRAKYETARLDSGVAQRPVIRMQGGIVLTRIDPSVKETSMIMRIRPGWDALRAFLAPDSKGKRRFDVYVCTAAERGYALEAWRLLDHNSDIIPDAVRAARVVCVPGGQKKELRKVLHVQAAIKFESGEGAPQAACAMPMAIIVDDRLDVWEPESQDQVLQVAPFAPHRSSPLGQGQMSNPQVRQAMVDEMALVKDRMTAVRGHVYYDINHKLKPAVGRLMQHGQLLEEILANDVQIFPPVRTVAQLLKVRNLMLPTGVPPPPVAPAFVATDSLLPHDPCKPRRGPTLQPPPSSSQVTQQQPVDPRKPRTGPGAIPSQPLTRPGAVASQPSTSGPPGIQPWRPSPSFREQQQQEQQQPDALHPLTSSHSFPNGSTEPHQQPLPPQDPRRARQQQQTQLLPPPPLAGIQQGLNGFHVSGAGQAADGPGPSYGQQAPGAAGHRAPAAALHVDVALPEIKQQITWPNFNPVSLIKEAADKQKVVCKWVERSLPTRPGLYHAQFHHQVIWEGQEIGSAVENDKKTAKKQAATRAVDFLLKYTPATPLVPAPVVLPEGPAASAALGDLAGPSGRQGSSVHPEKPLIKEDNALATLQAAFPKEVKYKTVKGLHHSSGKFCEEIDVMGGFHVARGTTTTKQAAKRWAAMRLLQQLKHVISPAFYNDTPEGEQRASKGPTQAEFEAATKLLIFNGKPVPKPRPQLPLQAQQQQQHAFGLGNTNPISLHEQGQSWQSRQAELASSRGVKRAVDGVQDAGSHAAKRGKYADQASTSQSEQGASLIDLTGSTAQPGYLDPRLGFKNINADVKMEDEASHSGDANNMPEEPPEQSGYPTDPTDEEEDQHGQSPAAEEGVNGRGQARWGTAGYGHLENHMPDSDINMQRADHSAFLAAVKKQSKVKEGDWSEVKQQHGGSENEDGMVDID
ncbi:hypothetical protein WJX77_006444 [Trebouxia sp. C0004]